jgi:ribosomal protein S18 acetylase RimI-like enzyme
LKRGKDSTILIEPSRQFGCYIRCTLYLAWFDSQTVRALEILMQPSRQRQLIDVYDANDAEAMVELLGDVFARRDPPAVAVGLTPEEFQAFVRPFCGKAALEGVTVVARKPGARELLGALLTEDSGSGLPEGMDRLSPKFEPIFDILGQLDAEYKQAHTSNEPTVHLFLLGVAESAAGMGLAQQLVTGCLDNAARKGYRRAVTEATNPTSQHIFRKLGFAERVRRSYGDYRWNGRAVFESIATFGGPILMDKSLQV